MPRITGSRVAGAYGPRLLLDWSILEQDVSGNRSKVKVSVSMDVDGAISYTSKGNVRIAIGSSVANYTPSTSSGSTARSRYLAQHTAWVPHNSDGTKTVSIKADWTGVGLTWINTYVNSVSAGGNASLTKIARTTTINSASVNYTLQTDANNSPIANSISLSLNIGSSSFRHRIWLEYNGVFVGEWTDQTNPTSLALNTTHVGRMLGHLSNSTSGTFRLYVGTDSGGTRIGYSSINITANVHSAVVPKFNSNVVDISGSGIDKNIGIYIQSFSRAYVSLSGEAGHGATVTKTSIRIGSSLIVSGTSGSITGNSSVISSSGTVSLEYSITDSRGRTTKETKSINVQPYSNPAIKEFSVIRSSDPTKATIKYTVEHSTLGGRISLTVNPRQDGTIVGGTSYWGNDARVSNTLNIAITGLNKFSTYEFTISIQDGMGNGAESAITLTSSSLPLSLDKNNQGIGVGKDYTKGALDVGGDAYIDGKLYVNSKEVQSTAGSDSLGDLNTVNNVANGVTFQHMSASATNNPGQAWGFLIDVMGGTANNAQFFLQRDGYQKMFTRAKTNGAWKNWNQVAYESDVVPTRGSNSNGEWVRFPDGTQIAWKENQRIDTYVSGRVLSKVWTLPVTFTSIRPTCFVEKDAYSGSNAVNKSTTGSLVEPNSAGDYTTANIYIYFGDDAPAQSNYGVGVRAMVIGRWK